jgi:hypothetical protein
MGRRGLKIRIFYVGGRSKGASGSFLKKRTKKLLVRRALATLVPLPAGAKVFLLLFFKKRRLLYLRTWALTDPRRSEAIPVQEQLPLNLDCFAALAMTWMGRKLGLLVFVLR